MQFSIAPTRIVSWIYAFAPDNSCRWRQSGSYSSVEFRRMKYREMRKKRFLKMIEICLQFVHVMPMEWCSRLVAQRRSTQVGCKVRHPRGGRRIDGQLAQFISEMYATVDETNQLRTVHRLCRRCCKRENANFNASHRQQRDFSSLEHSTNRRCVIL